MAGGMLTQKPESQSKRTHSLWTALFFIHHGSHSRNVNHFSYNPHSVPLQMWVFPSWLCTCYHSIWVGVCQWLSRVRLFVPPCGLPGSSVHGILQARILEWAAISLSNLGGSRAVMQSAWPIRWTVHESWLSNWISHGANQNVFCLFFN